MSLMCTVQKWKPVKNFVFDDSRDPKVRKVLVRELEHSTSYYFIVRSRNQYGLSPPSPPSDLIKTQSTFAFAFLFPAATCHWRE